MSNTLRFKHNGRAYEVRVKRNHKSFVCHVWEGEREASSVPFTVSQDEVEEAEARGALDQVLEAAMAEVRDAVFEGRLAVEAAVEGQTRTACLLSPTFQQADINGFSKQDNTGAMSEDNQNR